MDRHIHIYDAVNGLAFLKRVATGSPFQFLISAVAYPLLNTDIFIQDSMLGYNYGSLLKTCILVPNPSH